MAEELNTILTDGAQSAEDENRLAGNMQDAPVVDPSGSVDNPGGSTPTGGATDNTGTEVAPETQPPAAAVTQDIPPPTVDETGSSGGIAGNTTTNEAPQQPTVEQTPVAQSDPTLGTATPLAASEAPVVTAPTAAVLPTPDDVPDPTNEDLRAAENPAALLDRGQTAEQGLDEGSSPSPSKSQLVTTRGELQFGDLDGLAQISSVSINGQVYSLAQIQSAGTEGAAPIIIAWDIDGDGDFDGQIQLTGYSQNAEGTLATVGFDFTLLNSVQNDVVGNANVTDLQARFPIQLTVTTAEADGSTGTASANGWVVALDDEPYVVPSTNAADLHLDQTLGDDDRFNPNPEFNAQDESAGLQSAGFQQVSIAVSNYFTADTTAGADGEAGRSATFVLLPNADGNSLIDSGFQGLIDGEIVSLYLFKAADGSVYAAPSSDGPALIQFQIVAVDNADPQLVATIDQSLGSIYHSDGTLFDDVSQLNVSGGVFGIQLTLVDGDTDTDLGVYVFQQGDITVDDDGPSIVGSFEVTGPQLSTSDALTVDASSNADSSSFYESFLGSITAGFGSDGFGSVELSGWNLSLTTTASGLTTNGGTQEIILSLSADGKTVYGTTASASPTGETVGGVSNVIFSIQVDGSGNVTTTQYGAVDHLTALGEGADAFLASGSVILGATYTATDRDGDAVTTTITTDLGGNVQFENSVPAPVTTKVVTGGDVMVTQDADTVSTAKDTSNSISFATAFLDSITPNYSGDLNGAEVLSGWNLSLTTTASGLTTNGGTQEIILSLSADGKTVYGTTASASPTGETVGGVSNVIFSIQVDGSGNVTTTQYGAVDHLTALGEGADAFLASGSVILGATYTATDRDGDAVTTTITTDLGGNVQFENSVPAPVTTKVVTGGDVMVTQDADTVSTAKDTSNSISFATAFLDSITPNYSGDLNGAEVLSGWNLSLTTTASGLTTNGGTQEIILSLSADGKTVYGTTASASPTGETVGGVSNVIFSIQVDGSGNVTTTQYGAVDHLTALGEGADAFLASGSVILGATYTATDRDGDAVTTTITTDLGGNVQFENSVPAPVTTKVVTGGDVMVTQDADTVSTAKDTSNSISFATAFLDSITPNYSGDLNGAEVLSGWNLSLTTTASGLTTNGGTQEIILSLSADGKTVYGTTASASPTGETVGGVSNVIFSIQVDGSGNVTTTQYGAVDHLTALGEGADAFLASGSVILGATYTATDRDGDAVTTTITTDLGGNVQFENSVPAPVTTKVVTGGDVMVTQDADTVSTAKDTSNSISFATAFLDSITPNYSGDLNGAEVLSGWNLSLTTTASGLTTNGGTQEIILSLSADGKTVYGTTASASPTGETVGGVSNVIFSIQVDGSGNVTTTQYGAVDHLTALGEGADAFLASGSVILGATYTATDRDGDAVTTTITTDLGGNVQFENSVPAPVTTKVVTGGDVMVTQDADTVSTAKDTSNSISFATAFLDSITPNYSGDLNGAEVLSGWNLSLTTTASGLTTNGGTQEIILSLSADGKTVYGTTASVSPTGETVGGVSNVIFSIQVDGSGNVTTTQYGAVDHLTALGEGADAFLASGSVILGATYTATDRDGDAVTTTITTDLGGNVQFENSVPAPVTTKVVTGGDVMVTQDADTVSTAKDTSNSISFATAFLDSITPNYSGDLNGAEVLSGWNLSLTTTASGLTTNGGTQEIILSLSADGKTVYGTTASASPTGETVGGVSNVIFSIQVDGSGNVTTTQYGAVDHLTALGEGADAFLASGSVILGATYTATDRDGDAVTTTITTDLGGNVQFENSVPAPVTTKVVTGGDVMVTQDADTVSTAKDTSNSISFATAFLDSITPNYSGDLNGAEVLSGWNLSLTTTASGLTTNGGTQEIILSLSADGKTVYGTTASASPTGETVGGVSNVIFSIQVDGSGNVTTTQYGAVDHLTALGEGADAFLASGSVILGATYTATDRDGDAVTTTITTDLGGNVQFENSVPAPVTTKVVTGGDVMVTQDADTVSTAKDTSNSISFATAFLDSITPNYSGDLNGAEVLSGWNLSLTTTASGLTTNGGTQEIILSLSADGKTVYGTTASASPTGETVGGVSNVIFSIQVDGSGNVTTTQYGAVDHLTALGEGADAFLASGSVILGATYTATDRDGDAVTTTITTDLGGNVQFENSVPAPVTTKVVTGGDVMVTQDADTVSTAKDTSNSISFATAFLDSITPNYSGDLNGAEVLSGWNLSLTTTASGLTTNGGTQEIILSLSADGKTVYGTTASASPTGETVGGVSNVIFSIQVDGSGNVTTTQYGAVDHLTALGEGADAFLASGSVILGATYTATDRDGDAVTTTITTDLGGNVQFENSVPAPVTTKVVTGGDVMVTQDADTVSTAKDTSNSISFATAFLDSITPNYSGDLNGAEVLSGWNLSLTTTASGLTTNGGTQEIILSLSADGKTVYGTTASASPTGETVGGVSNVIFSIQVDGSGNVTTTQYGAVDHLTALGEGADAFLASGSVILGATYTATDRDGDAVTTTITTDLGGNVQFENSVPAPVTTKVVTGGDVMVTQDADTVSTAKDTSNSISFATAFLDSITPNYSGDLNGAEVLSGWNLSLTTTASGLTTNGGTQEIILSLSADGKTVYGTTASVSPTGETVGGVSNVIFSIQVDGSGNVTTTQYGAVDHLTALGEGADAFLASGSVILGATYTATDRDGDAVTTTITTDLGGNVQFENSVPAPVTTKVVTGGDVMVTQDADTVSTAKDTSNSISFATAFLDSITPNYSGDLNGAEVLSGWNLSLTTTASGLTTNGGTQEIILSLSADGKTVYGTTASVSPTGETVGGVSNVIFSIQVDGSGNVTTTQYGAVDHLTALGEGADAFLASGSVILGATYTATDRDGDAVTTTITTDLGGNVQFENGVPLIYSSAASDGTPDDVYLQIQTPTSSSGTKYTASILNWSSGPDLASSFGITSLTPGYSYLSGGTGSSTLSYNSITDTLSFELWRSYSSSGTTVWEKVAYYELNGSGDDSVTVYPYTGVTTVTQLIDGSGAKAGGPVPTVYVDLLTADATVKVTCKTGSASDLVNASSQGWAVGNQNIDPTESITFSFYDYNTNRAALVPEGVSKFSFTMPKPTGGGTTFEPSFIVAYTTGSQSFDLNAVPSGAYVVVTYQGVFVYASQSVADSGGAYLQFYAAVDPDGSLGPLTAPVSTTLFTSIQITNDGGGANFNINNPALTTVNESTSIPDLDFSFNLQIQDRDGDISSITVGTQIDGDDAAAVSGLRVLSTVAPVAIDLNRDSVVQYLSSADGVQFDYGSGLVYSGWVSAPDGMLVYDYNHDSLVTEAKELVLTMWGDDSSVVTDVQALQAYFDSDYNGVFDGNDAAWGCFGVWQDVNADGVQQQGEFNTLDHWGIESIALSHNAGSQPYAAADGDVQVYGQIGVSYDDGYTGLAEDMAFVVQSSGTTVDGPLAATTEPAYPVDALVTSYLETIAATGDTDGNGDLSVGELAYGLDDTVTQFIESYGYSVDDHAAIQQEVLNELAHELNDLSPDDGIDIAFDATGDANGADVLAALDDHFMDIYDAHMTPAESYDDPGSMV